MKRPQVKHSQLLKVPVGPEEIVFSVPKQTFCKGKSSLFFRAACKEYWMAPDDKAIRLPETDHQTFHLYSNYLHHMAKKDEVKQNRCSALHASTEPGGHFSGKQRSYSNCSHHQRPDILRKRRSPPRALSSRYRS